MSLLEKLRQDQITAMKAKDTEKLSVLRMLNSAIKNEQIASGKPCTDNDALRVVARHVKQLNDALKDFIAGNRTDLIDKTKQEIAIAEAYLPAQMDEQELKSIVEKTIAELGVTEASATGQVMGAVMKKVGSAADGNRVREIVSTLLNQNSESA